MTDQAEKNQDLIDRYIAAVGRRLPAKTAADISAELHEAVSSRLEEKEKALGRAADRKETAEVIKSFGSPMLVAARYTGPEYLLGPEIFPYYWPVARIVVGIVAAVAMVGFLVQGVLSDNPLPYALKGIAAAWNGALLSFAVVTGIFIAMDRGKAGAKIEQSWRPESLPAYTQDKPKSLFESLFSLAWDAIFIAWWVGLLHFPNSLPGKPGEEGMTLDFNSAAGAAAFAPVLAMAVLQAVIHVADVLHPTWSRVRGLAATVSALIGLWVVWMLGQAGQLLTVSGPADVADRVSQLNATFIVVSQMIVYGLAIGFGIALVVEVWRLVRSFQVGSSGAATMPKA